VSGTDDSDGSAVVDGGDEFVWDRADSVMFAIEIFIGEWHNGGFDQMFTNWQPEQVEELVPALREVGAERQADVIVKAIAVMGSREEWRSRAGHAMRNWQTDPLHAQLQSLDREMSDLADDLQERLARYELAHSGDADEDDGSGT